jgi:protein-disulfide isomerase
LSKRRKFSVTGAALAMCVVASTTAFPQDNQTHSEIERLRKDVESLKKVQKAIITELRILHDQINGSGNNQSPAPQAVDFSIDIANLPHMGAREAQVAVVEFSDFECPYCGRHFESTLPRIADEYVKTGKIVYVIRDFPIAQLHPHALKAAEAGRCAADQGKFWPMHDMLFSNQEHLEAADLLSYAPLVGLDKNAFEKCFSDAVHSQDVKQAVTYGISLGVNATPTFFIGRIDANKATVHATVQLAGAYPYSIFKQKLDEALNSHQ